MDSPFKKPGFGALQLPAINAKLAPAVRPDNLGDLDELVLLSVRVSRADYLHLLEAQYWVAGFKQQDFIQKALRNQFAALGDAVQPLPIDVLSGLVRRNKKLQKGG